MIEFIKQVICEYSPSIKPVVDSEENVDKLIKKLALTNYPKYFVQSKNGISLSNKFTDKNKIKLLSSILCELNSQIINILRNKYETKLILEGKTDEEIISHTAKALQKGIKKSLMSV